MFLGQEKSPQNDEQDHTSEAAVAIEIHDILQKGMEQPLLENAVNTCTCKCQQGNIATQPQADLILRSSSYVPVPAQVGVVIEQEDK